MNDEPAVGAAKLVERAERVEDEVSAVVAY